MRYFLLQVVSCVVLSERASDELALLGVKDSKKVSPARREQLYEEICSTENFLCPISSLGSIKFVCLFAF